MTKKAPTRKQIDKANAVTMAKEYEKRFPGRAIKIPKKLPPGAIQMPGEHKETDTEEALQAATQRALQRTEQIRLNREIAQKTAELKCLQEGHQWANFALDSYGEYDRSLAIPPDHVQCLSCHLVGRVIEVV